MELTVPAGAAPGLYPVRAELAATGGGDSRVVAPDGRGRLHDLARDSTTTRCCDWSPSPGPSTSPRATPRRLRVTVGTDAHADLAVEAHLISALGDLGVVGPQHRRRRGAGTGHGRAGVRRRAAGVDGTGPVVGTDPRRVRGGAALHTGGRGHGAVR